MLQNNPKQLLSLYKNGNYFRKNPLVGKNRDRYIKGEDNDGILIDPFSHRTSDRSRKSF